MLILIPSNLLSCYFNLEPHPPPENVHLSSVDSKSLTFSWNPVINSSCQALSYSITSRNCGICPTTSTGVSVTCVSVPVDGSVCLFQVQTIVCHNNHGPLSASVPVELTGEFVASLEAINYCTY